MVRLHAASRVLPLRLFLGAVLVVGGCMFLYQALGKTERVFVRSDSSETYSFINATVVAGLDKHFIVNFLPLRKELEEIVSNYSQKSFVYFAYLNNSSWIGINERELFYAASTTKVPLAMATLTAVEQGKIKLSDTYVLEASEIDDGFGSLHEKGEGTVLTVEQLLEIMLEQSDNTAAMALTNLLSKIGIQNPLDVVYSAMGWEFGTIGESANYEKINLKTLSNMFISLYNANFLGLDNSQFVLSKLSRTSFNDGIVAGVPVTIPVAHKVGIADQYKGYSDCGIVYAPQRNYLLCVGTEGVEKEAANEFTADISRAVYNYVINN